MSEDIISLASEWHEVITSQFYWRLSSSRTLTLTPNSISHPNPRPVVNLKFQFRFLTKCQSEAGKIIFPDRVESLTQRHAAKVNSSPSHRHGNSVKALILPANQAYWVFPEEPSSCFGLCTFSYSWGASGKNWDSCRLELVESVMATTSGRIIIKPVSNWIESYLLVVLTWDWAKLSPSNTATRVTDSSLCNTAGSYFKVEVPIGVSAMPAWATMALNFALYFSNNCMRSVLKLSNRSRQALLSSSSWVLFL